MQSGKQIKPKELGLLRILLGWDLINSKIFFLKLFYEERNWKKRNFYEAMIGLNANYVF